MTEKDALTTRQRRFVAALATQPTIRAAAATAQIAEVTAWRYLADPACQARAGRASRRDA